MEVNLRKLLVIDEGKLWAKLIDLIDLQEKFAIEKMLRAKTEESIFENRGVVKGIRRIKASLREVMEEEK